jgi:hypothetical protein
MSKWFSPLALTALLLVVASFVAMLAIATFTDWVEPGAPAATPGATVCPWSEEWQERYLDEAWQQFSH